MSLNESIVEEAALEWFGEQTRVARTLTRPLPRGEEMREAIRRLNPAIPEEASACALHGDRLATIRPYRIVRLERRLNP
jgi:hypothetical protein